MNNTKKSDCVISYEKECITQSELNSITQNSSQRDSEWVVKQYVNDWLIDQILFKRAQKNVHIQDDELDQYLNKVKRQYYISEYLKEYIQQNLDTTVSEEEILKYYETHKETFKLSNNIVQIYYIKLNDNEQDITEFKKLLSTTKKDKTKLNMFILTKASSYFIEDSLWLKWEDVIKEIPVLKNYPLNYYIKGKMIEWRSGTYYYYVKIKDYRIKNEFSPLTYEKEKIKRIIIEQRKQKLINDLKAQVMQEARQLEIK